MKQVKAGAVPATFVFVAPPSLEVLEARLRARGTETEEKLQKRLDSAVAEMRYAREPGAHDFVVVNDDAEKAYREFEGVFLRILEAKAAAR